MRVEMRHTVPQPVEIRRPDPPRAAYVLAVSGVLGLVTFTLVCLSTLSFAGGF